MPGVGQEETCLGRGMQPTPLCQMEELRAGEKCEAVLCQLSVQGGREVQETLHSF